MKYIRQFVIILFISFIGEALKYVLPLPIPASIYGLVLMFVLLETKVLKVEAVQDAGKFLIEIMPQEEDKKSAVEQVGTSQMGDLICERI